jgi:DNA topoisomerase-1
MELENLSHRELLLADRDTKKAAEIASLVYVNDSIPGITRVKKGKGYSYLLNGEKIHDKDSLDRIKKLAIPPSWKNVWICPDPHGHIQATGLDLNGRKQYRYHTKWNSLRNETKFHRLYEFGKTLPLLRKQVQKDIGSNDLNVEKVIATVISLMEKTYIRIGNNGYEKLYGSYGLTTLKDQHVDIKKDSIRFSFTGKKGIEHDITLKSKKLARIIKQCRDIPGKELFQYYDTEGNKKKIDSGMINSYIKNVTGQEFSAKDFRTWSGTLQAISCLRSLAEPMDESETKKNILAMLDEVSRRLGNSRNICRKYYVHPGLVKLYEEGKLVAEFKKCNEKKFSNNGMLKDEKILLYLLKKCI